MRARTLKEARRCQCPAPIEDPVIEALYAAYEKMLPRMPLDRTFGQFVESYQNRVQCVVYKMQAMVEARSTGVHK